MLSDSNFEQPVSQPYININLINAFFNKFTCLLNIWNAYTFH